MKLFMVFLILTVSFAGCTRYQTKYTAFRPPEGYGNFQIVDGVKVGGEAYVDNDAAEDAFGFDVKGAGLLPVQLVLDNRSGKNTEIVADQTFLVDKNNGYWRIIPTNVAISRLENSTQLAAYFGKGAGKGAILGAAAGTALGAALGIVSGRNVGGGALRGGALGTAGGAVIGGTSEGSSQERGRRITDDLRAKSLEGKVIPADHLANGFIFFPGEAESAKELRLRLRQPESEAERTVVLGFPQKLGK